MLCRRFSCDCGSGRIGQKFRSRRTIRYYSPSFHASYAFDPTEVHQILLKCSTLDFQLMCMNRFIIAVGDMQLCLGSVGVKGRVAYMGQRPFIQNSSLRENITFGKFHCYYRMTCAIDN